MLPIRFVCATRVSRKEFFESRPLGLFINLWKDTPNIEVDLYPENNHGLSKVYNNSIERAKDSPAILVFAHDDITITDHFWIDRLIKGVNEFDIIGVIGNKRITQEQVSWCKNIDTTNEPDEFLSGTVAIGHRFSPGWFVSYGESNTPVKLLDGMFLSCYSSTLIKTGLRFDEQFDFNFYDLDFCRQADQLGLTMGTWNISVVHESMGYLSGENWYTNGNKYFDKWVNK